MSNPAIQWIKEHPAITASVAAGVGLIVYLMSRSSGSGSLAGSVAQAQTANAALATQNAQTQAAAQVQEQTAAYAAQVQNNQNEAALAAVIAQQNATQNTAQIAANVAINQTNQQAAVATAQVNAQSAATEAQINAESQLVQTEFGYYTQANEAANAEIEQLMPQLGTHTGNYSQTIGAIIAALANQPGPSESLSNLALGQQVSQNNTTASNVANVTKGVSSVLTSLFA